MIGDNIILKDKHLELAKQIIGLECFSELIKNKTKIVIGIGGESGSGKSVCAFALSKILNDKKIKTCIFQQDDYFFLPPKFNHQNRERNIDSVGLQEVNLNLISENIKDFKTSSNKIAKTIVNYQENSISCEQIDLTGVEVLIVEGTYVLSIDNFDFTIFIDKNYLDTYQNRILRNRDEICDFIEKVLEIEHKIIRKLKHKANLILDKNYKIIK